MVNGGWSDRISVLCKCVLFSLRTRCIDSLATASERLFTIHAVCASEAFVKHDVVNVLTMILI